LRFAFHQSTALPSRAASSEQRVCVDGHRLDTSVADTAATSVRERVQQQSGDVRKGLSTTTVGRPPRRFIKPGREPAPPERRRRRRAGIGTRENSACRRRQKIASGLAPERVHQYSERRANLDWFVRAARGSRAAPEFHLRRRGPRFPRVRRHGTRRCARALASIMILPQVHLRKPCYDFYFL
jgi:hypothetical protein